MQKQVTFLIGYEGSQVPNEKEKRTKEQAKAKAEAILAQVNANPDSFLMLAFTSILMIHQHNKVVI